MKDFYASTTGRALNQALRVAARDGDAATALFSAGANVNAIDNQDFTPLHWAVQNSHAAANHKPN